MAHRPFHASPGLTARYDELERVIATRYGPDSQAMVFLLHDQLIALRTARLEHPGSLVLAARIAALRERLRDAYRRGPAPGLPDMPVRSVGTDPPLREFARDTFERRYAAAAETIRPQVRTVDGPRLGDLRPGRSYMYVLDDTGALRVWNRPFALDELVFGRNRATVAGIPVAHPMLVPDRLRAVTAGEIVFIGSPEPAAVIANTKSGHFRPPPSTLGPLRESLRATLGLDDRALDLFALGIS